MRTSNVVSLSFKFTSLEAASFCSNPTKQEKKLGNATEAIHRQHWLSTSKQENFAQIHTRKCWLQFDHMVFPTGKAVCIQVLIA